MPSALGTVACIIIEPLILPRAKVSLPWRTQITAFKISGSSVAMGLKSKETTRGGTFHKVLMISKF